MDDAACINFFSRPTHTYHRQYEALRAVFVDGRSQKDVSQEFGFEYDSFRQLVGQFRRSVSTRFPSNESPFFETSR